MLTFTSNVSALELVISGNGERSVNEVVVKEVRDTSIDQSNEANVANDIDIAATTGENTAADNSGDVAIETGDTSAEVTIENSANVSSVEIGCCPEGDSSLEISGNASNSENAIDLDKNRDVDISIDQTANITNNVTGYMNTGDNVAKDNSGSILIDTGDIKVEGVIENGPVNIANFSGGSNPPSFEAQISNNASDSTNFINLDFNDIFSFNINNNAYIENNVDWDLNTGGNRAKDNVGDVEILTGDVFFDFFIKNGPMNFGGISWGCCGVDDPGDSGGSPSDDPSDPDEPSGPGGPGDPGNGAGGDNGSTDGGGSSSPDDGGSLLAEAASTGAFILGLSDTSSEATQSLFFWAGIAMVALGSKILAQELAFKASKVKS